jgi:hypothetical protein
MADGRLVRCTRSPAAREESLGGFIVVPRIIRCVARDKMPGPMRILFNRLTARTTTLYREQETAI